MNISLMTLSKVYSWQTYWGANCATSSGVVRCFFKYLPLNPTWEELVGGVQTTYGDSSTVVKIWNLKLSAASVGSGALADDACPWLEDWERRDLAETGVLNCFVEELIESSVSVWSLGLLSRVLLACSVDI